MTRSNADPSRLIRRAEFALLLAYWSPLGVTGFVVQDSCLPHLDRGPWWAWVWFVPAATATLLGALAAAGGSRLLRGRDAVRAGAAAVVVGSATLACGIPTVRVLADTRYRWSSPSRSAMCVSNAKQVGLALLMYTADFDGCTPPAGGWNEGIYPYTKNRSILTCPEAAESQTPTDAMNARICRLDLDRLAEPGSTVLFFESSPGPDRVGGPEVLADPPWHGQRNTVGVADGHVKSLTLAEAKRLSWRPTLAPKRKPAAKPAASSPKVSR